LAQRQSIVVVLLTASRHAQGQLLVQPLPVNDFITMPLTRVARHLPVGAA